MQTPNNSLTFFFGWYVILCASSSGTHLGTGRRAVKKPFVLWNAPLRRRQLYWRTLTLSFLSNCGLTPLHMVWVPLLYSFISTETAAWLPTRHKLWKNTTKHSVTSSDLFHRSEIQWLMCLLHAAKHVSNDNYSHFSRTIRQIWIASALYNCPQFRSEEFAHFMKVNGVKHIRVAPYHAASNVSGERMVHSFKNHMKACKGSKLSICWPVTCT